MFSLALLQKSRELLPATLLKQLLSIAELLLSELGAAKILMTARAYPGPPQLEFLVAWVECRLEKIWFG
jgi:hypothetical protein